MSKNRVKKELFERMLFEKICGGIWFKDKHSDKSNFKVHDNEFFVKSNKKLDPPKYNDTLATIRWDNNPNKFKIRFHLSYTPTILRFFGINDHYWRDKLREISKQYFLRKFHEEIDSSEIDVKTKPSR